MKNTYILAIDQGTTGSRAFISIVLLFMVIPLAAWEYPNPPPTDEALLQRADRVVVARCIRSKAQESQGGYIQTHVDFETLETIKGTISSAFTVILPGGRIGDKQVSIGGLSIPEFNPGEEIILLLGPDRDGYPTSMLGYDWFYRTRRDSVSGWIVENPPGIKLLKAGTQNEIFAPEAVSPVNSVFQPHNQDEAINGALNQVLSTNPKNIFTNVTVQDFSKPVTVEDVVWSIKQTIEQKIP